MFSIFLQCFYKEKLITLFGEIIISITLLQFSPVHCYGRNLYYVLSKNICELFLQSLNFRMYYRCSGFLTPYKNFLSSRKILIYAEILELRAKFQTAMVSCSRFIWITISSDHRRVKPANLLHTR